MTGNIRVLIADDHEVIRAGLRMILSDCNDIQVVGEAENGLQAVELAQKISPDVILMDLRMPALDGLGATEKIKALCPEIAVVILTTYHENELIVRCLQAGAQGFLLKDIGRQAILDTIYAAFQGSTLLGFDTLNRLLPKLVNKTNAPVPAQRQHDASARRHPNLSQRELEVLRLVAMGARNKEVAAELMISLSTVKAHLDSIFNKLGVDSRVAAVSMASQYGLLAEYAKMPVYAYCR